MVVGWGAERRVLCQMTFHDMGYRYVLIVTVPPRPDLVFPHHENEIAQSPNLNGRYFLIMKGLDSDSIFSF